MRQSLTRNYLYISLSVLVATNPMLFSQTNSFVEQEAGIKNEKSNNS